MPREIIDRQEGRRVFGLDPAGYDMARPGHPGRVYEVLIERCGLGPGARVLEIGLGTGQATRRLLELGASPLVALEPDPRLAVFLDAVTDRRVQVQVARRREVVLDAVARVAADTFGGRVRHPLLTSLYTARFLG